MRLEYRDFGPIGVIGAGHLGAVLALELLKHGLAPDKLFVSVGGSGRSVERLRKLGLETNIVSNEKIAAVCPYVFATLRPSGWEFLAMLELAPNATILSTIAGVTATRLESVTGRRCIHIMPSGPDTIAEGKGLCAAYPPSPDATDLLSVMGMQVVPLGSEDEMDVFTAAVCLPAVVVAAHSMGVDLERHWIELENDFPAFAATVRWARGVAPDLPSESERQAYIERMATKGGVTEVIVESFRSGQSMSQSLSKGVARCREIARSSR